MENIFEKIAVISIVFLAVAVLLTIRENRQKKKLFKEKEKLQEIIEAKNRQMEEIVSQNKAFGDILKESLSGGEIHLKSYVADAAGERVYDKKNYLELVLKLERLACEKHGIDFRVNIKADLELLPFSETDMVRLFCNLLDNAIEAAKDLENPYIEFEIAPMKSHNQGTMDGLQIIIKNSKNSRIKPLENGFATTKKDGDVHGRGTGIIREIVEKYNCRISWQDLGDEFVTEILCI